MIQSHLNNLNSVDCKYVTKHICFHEVLGAGHGGFAVSINFLVNVNSFYWENGTRVSVESLTIGSFIL